MAGARLAGEISRDLGLRLTALRETFEESGIFVGTDREAVSLPTKRI